MALGMVKVHPSMAKGVIHISEAEAASDFAVIIEHDAEPVAVVHPAERRVRLLSESLRLAREHGSKATLDEGFSRDLEEVINSHREPLTHRHGTNPRFQRRHRGGTSLVRRSNEFG
jgi:hypothetical protein